MGENLAVAAFLFVVWLVPTPDLVKIFGFTFRGKWVDAVIMIMIGVNLVSVTIPTHNIHDMRVILHDNLVLTTMVVIVSVIACAFLMVTWAVTFPKDLVDIPISTKIVDGILTFGTGYIIGGTAYVLVGAI